MDDLISRQAAIKAIRKDLHADKDYMSAMICEGIEDVLNGLPAAEPERKKGKWIEADLDKNFRVCSVCKNKGYKDCMAWRPDYIKAYFNFCPNCGADMRGEEDG